MPLGEPPDSLTGFPTVLLEGRVLARIHRVENDPIFFSTSGDGRFDLDPDGTLYAAATPVGAFIEVFRGRVVPLAEVHARRLAMLECRGPLTLANLTDPGARGFGVTAEIHATPDYSICRRWASALHGTGFHGVVYRLRHDPSGTEEGVALFGGALRARLTVAGDGPIGDPLVAEVRARFGVLVLPSAPA